MIDLPLKNDRHKKKKTKLQVMRVMQPGTLRKENNDHGNNTYAKEHGILVNTQVAMLNMANKWKEIV